MTSYFVAVGDDRRGPFTLEELKSKAVPLLPTTLVWHRGMSKWAQAESVAEVAAVLEPNPDEPPPFKMAAATTDEPVFRVVPNWIVTYAVVITPIVWVLQRGMSIVEVATGSGGDGIAFVLTLMLGWSLITMVVTGMVVGGGVQGSRNPAQQSSMLRWGFGLKMLMHLLVLVFGILSITFNVFVRPRTQVAAVAPTEGNVGDIVALFASVLWIATVIADAFAWARLRKARSQARTDDSL